MNYQRLHDAIILQAQTNPPTGYTEKHHIVPRCMGGTNDKTNLVRLTARAHFVVHRLLCKIHPDNHKLRFAFNMMFRETSNRTRGVDFGWVRSVSKNYAEHRKQFSKSMSITRKGIVMSEIHRANLSKAHMGFVISSETRAKLSAVNMGRIVTAETRARIGAGQKGRIGRSRSTETKNKISAALSGRTKSIETRAKISAAATGRQVSTDTKNKIRAVVTGRIVSEETKQKMSESQRIRWQLRHNRKPLLLFDN